MKSKTLEQQIREAARTNRAKAGIIVPGGRTYRTWPLCLTCGREVEAVELKDVSNKGCELWARCHGKEDYYKVTWDVPTHDTAGTNILDDKNVGWAIKRAMHDFSPFNPTHIFDVSRK